MLLTKLHNPVEEAVKHIIKNTSLMTIPKQYRPWQDVLKLKNESAFPLVTCTTMEMRIDTDSTYAEIDVMIAVYDLAPPEDSISTEEERALWLAMTSQKYHSDLLEVTDWLGNVSIGMDMFEKEGYKWVSDRFFRPQFRRNLYTTKEEFKSHPINERLYASTVMGTLRGTLKAICCDSQMVVPDLPEVLFVYPDGVVGAKVGVSNDPAIETYTFQFRLKGDEAWGGMDTYNRHEQVVIADVATGIVPGNEYEGRVQGVSYSGKETEWVTFDWLMFTNVATPVVSAITPGQTTANVVWGAVPNAVEYDIRYRIQGSETWTYVYNNADTDFFISGLTANSTYELGIQAETAITAKSEWSSDTFNTTA